MSDFLSINRRRPYFTYALIAVNLLFFAAESILQLFFMPEGQMLVLLGAKINPLIARGELWRLLTACFLHSGPMHILFNLFALYIWGPQVEALLGRLRFGIVYTGAGLFGSLCSFLFSNSVSVGASGAIFGLFGAFLYFRTRHRQVFNQVFGMQLLVVIGANLVMGFLNAGTDNFAHIGGLIGGFSAAFSTGLYREKWTLPRALAALGLALLFLCALEWGMRRYGGSLFPFLAL
ncbi:MAG: rhomboid family intramembrane serine protease [Christensenellaceae bacterium]|jgi:rhomboid protease GluP|nr:rhomboid family intramembrane serine protease [Christensenellaceae bacterium]